MLKQLRFIFFLSMMLVLSSMFASAKNPSDQFNLAGEAFSNGYYHISQNLFEKFINDFPANSLVFEARIYLAQCDYFQGAYSKSISSLLSLSDKNADPALNSRILYWLSRDYFAQDYFKEALSYSLKIIDRYSRSREYWPAYCLGGSCYNGLGEYDKARKFFEKVIAECKDHVFLNQAYEKLMELLARRKEYLRVLSLTQNYLKTHPNSSLSFKAWFYQGEALYAQGNFDPSMVCFRRALKLSRDDNFNDKMIQSLVFSFIAKGNSVDAQKWINRIKNDDDRGFTRGAAYFKNKEFYKALSVFDDFLEKFPKSDFATNSLLYRADTFYELGRINDAIFVYRKFLVDFKGSKYDDFIDKAHYGLGWCYLKKSEYKEAIDEFRRSYGFTDDPIVKISSRIQMADANIESGKYAEGLRIYRSINTDSFKDVYGGYVRLQTALALIKTGAIKEAIASLEGFEKDFPDSKLIPGSLYALAQAYCLIDNWTAGAKTLENLLSRKSLGDIGDKAKYLYGVCLLESKEEDKSLNIFKPLAKGSGEFYRQSFEVVLKIYFDSKDWRDAKDFLTGLIENNPQSLNKGMASFYLGRVYQEQGLLDKAKEQYQKVIKDNEVESAKQARFSLGYLYLNDNDADTALKFFSQAAQGSDEVSILAKLAMADIYRQRGEIDKALRFYDDISGSGFDCSAKAWLAKAQIFQDKQDYGLAAASFRKAISAGLNSPDVRLAYGLCLEKSSKYQEALGEYQKIVSGQAADQEISTAYLRIARLEEKNGRLALAKQAYSKLALMDTEEAKIAKIKLSGMAGKSKQ